jgi:diguanylate cyclase (GGDEF)-like protein
VNSSRPFADMLCILFIDKEGCTTSHVCDLLDKSVNVCFTVDNAKSAEDAHALLCDEIYDAILVSESISNWKSIGESLNLDHDDPFVPPVILIADEESRETDLAAQNAGFSDFLVKSQLSPPLLERSIRYSLERKQSEQRLTRLAFFDSLTGLPNRSSFKLELTERVTDSAFVESGFAVMLLDLDHFKDVNDTLGHPIGDQLLQAVSQRLSSCIEKNDFIARLGGDEFIICTREGLSREDIDEFAGSIVESLGAPYKLDNHDVRTAASIGIALCSQDGRSYPDLLKYADLALYRAKDAGRGTHIFFDAELLPT